MCVNWLCPVNRVICFSFFGEPYGIRIQDCPSKTTGAGIFNPLSSKTQSPFQKKLHTSGWSCTGVSAPKCFSDRSCHQWYFKSQSASHPAFQLSSLSVAGLFTHPYTMSFYQLNKWLTSPPSSCAAQLFHSPYLCLLNHPCEFSRLRQQELRLARTSCLKCFGKFRSF